MSSWKNWIWLARNALQPEGPTYPLEDALFVDRLLCGLSDPSYRRSRL
jgi:hypothetical protein